MQTNDYYQQSIEEVLQNFSVNPEVGLSANDINERLKKYGLNELPEAPPPSLIISFAKQFVSPLVYLLLIAAVISSFLGEFVDVAVILFALLINALIGAYQEVKAERILKEIKNLASPQAKVKRDGRVSNLDAKYLVPGDIIILESGLRVPADGRIFKSYLLEINESTFTGESAPVEKNTEKIKFKAPISQRHNLAYLGTTVVRGRGEMIVTTIGPESQTGQLSKTIEQIKKPMTPLFLQIAQFSKIVLWVVLFFSLLIFMIGLAQNYSLDAFNSAITLAVSAIPEGLPAMITITLALGIHRMAREKAVVQNLSTIDTLGTIDTLITDKTGTLTLNQFSVTSLMLLSGNSLAIHQIDQISLFQTGFKNILETAVLANDATSNNQTKLATDDPIEVALNNFASQFHEHRELFFQKKPRVFELPFESEYRYMATFHRHNSLETKVFLKGAPDTVLKICGLFKNNRCQKKLTQAIKKNILEEINLVQQSGEKVLAFASGIFLTDELQKTKWNHLKIRKLIENKIEFLGAISLSDPVRAQAANSIQTLQKAGINIIMATGDHPAVALKIADQVGLEPRLGKISLLNDRSVNQELKKNSVFAQVSPDLKLRMIKLLQRQNKVVAMTGDGVNDAPALRQSDVGIAMGQSGTDLAKEAADLVLLDDDISTITQAVESGRVIVANIKRIISYLIATNLSEVLVVVFGILIWGLRARPILPTQILWINLITDGIAVLPLALEPAHRLVMQKPPPSDVAPLLDRQRWLNIVIVSITICLISIITFGWIYSDSGDLARAQTLTFTVLVFAQLFNLLNSRSSHYSIFSRELAANVFIWYSVTASIIIQIFVLVLPPMRHFLHLKTLSLIEIVVAILISSIILWVVEIYKLLAFRTKNISN